MAVREVLRMGNPKLRQEASMINLDQIDRKELNTLVEDLKETMKAQRGIGIAAPQIGELVRLAIFDLNSDNDRYDIDEDSGLTVMVNPSYEALTDDAQAFWEGCLSVPGLRGLVARPSRIKLSYWTLGGESVIQEFEGFLATVIQHELDHLDGVLYVDRVEPPNLVFEEELDDWIQFLEQE
jgi:peptide deformylase